MKIAICGAHGVGKSTFAASLAESLELPLLPTPGRWMADRGFPINEEATVVSQVLAWLLQQTFEAEQAAWISARSLVDVWAYASLAAARDPDPFSRELFAALTTVTRTEVQDRYTVLLYVPPRIPLLPDTVRSEDEWATNPFVTKEADARSARTAKSKLSRVKRVQKGVQNSPPCRQH
jgi:hypothetical protein